MPDTSIALPEASPRDREVQHVVLRYSKWISEFRPRAGDFISVDGIEIGETQAIGDLEYRRAATENPKNPAMAMRPMFYTGSPFGAEILQLIANRKADP